MKNTQGKYEINESLNLKNSEINDFIQSKINTYDTFNAGIVKKEVLEKINDHITNYSKNTTKE
jgi:poly-beta-hydroxyalkanoate depolymerase